jgi:cell division protein FtsW
VSADPTPSPAEPRRRTVTPADRAAVNPFAALTGLLQRPMASFYLLLSAGGLLLTVGLLMVLSASSIRSYAVTGSAFTFFNNQLTYAGLGLVAFWFALRLRVRFFRLAGYGVLAVSAILLFVLFVMPSVGTEVNGAVLWIDLGPISIQPSEPAKLGLALWGADVLVRKRVLLHEGKHLMVPLFPVAAVVLALVGKEDLGGMLSLLLILLALLWVTGVRLRVLGMLGGVAMAAVVALIVVAPHRIVRLTSFLDPFADKQDTGHQAVQGLYALSTGGWWGVGLGASRAKWAALPEAHNDFIFAVIGEELGVIGCLLVISLFCVLAFAGLRIARRVTDPFARLAAAACTVWLAGQAFINMGGVVGLLPITGVTLPLISAGGSSLVLTMFVLGMLASFARSEPEAAAALHARGRTKWAKLLRIPLPPRPVPPRAAKKGAPPRAAKKAAPPRAKEAAPPRAPEKSGRGNTDSRRSTAGREGAAPRPVATLPRQRPHSDTGRVS